MTFFCSGVRLAKSSAAFLVCSSIIMSLQIFLQRGYMSIIALCAVENIRIKGGAPNGEEQDPRSVL